MSAVALDPAEADRLIEGQGVPDADWRASPGLRATPVITIAALLADVPRVVVVSPHPDDEVLGVGGLMALARAIDVDVHVVAVTDGEACYPRDVRWSRAQLAAIRRTELHDALDRLAPGITVDALGIADGGVRAAGGDIEGHLRSHLRADDLLLLPWRHDGHPDHEGVALAGLAAANALGCRRLEFPVWGWHWAAPDAGLLPLARAVRIALPADVHARKQAALDAFASQTGGGAFDIAHPILPPWALARFQRDFEVLFA